MRLLFKTLYIVLLVWSGLMFMRIMLNFAQLTGSVTRPVYFLTDIIVMPISLMLYGERNPMAVLNGGDAAADPSVIISLFVTLIAAFLVSMVVHALEKSEPVRAGK